MARGSPTRSNAKPLAAVRATVLIVTSWFFANDAFAQRNDTFNAAHNFQTIDHFGSHDSWTGQVYGASAGSTWLAAVPFEHNYKEFIYFDNANRATDG